jgi:hypothetical protein
MYTGIGLSSSPAPAPVLAPEQQKAIDLEVAKRKALSPYIMKEQVISSMIGGFLGVMATVTAYWMLSKTPWKKHANNGNSKSR